MKKKMLSITMLLVLIALVTSCASSPMFAPKKQNPVRVSAQGQAIASESKNPYHIIRTHQLKSLPAGATVGIVSGSGPSAFGVFMTAALESKGLVAREMSLYTLIPSNLQTITDPRNNFTFLDSLVQETVNVVKTTAVDGVDSEGNIVTSNIDLNSLINKMYSIDDIVTEKQRVDHYIELSASLKNMINEMNVDYILVGGAPYEGLSYSVKIYDTSNMDVVFSNVVISDIEDWRKMISAPMKSEGISYNFNIEEEPAPYWDLSYSEFIASKLIVE